MTIKAMENSDFKSLIMLVEENYGENYKRRLSEEYWKVQGSERETTWFIFIDDKNRENVKGAIGVSQVGEVAKIHGLMVMPKYQDNGVGKQLFERALEHAAVLDVNTIIGYARCTHLASQNLTEEYGFEPTGFLPNRILRLDAKSGSFQDIERVQHSANVPELESLVMYCKTIRQSVSIESRSFYLGPSPVPRIDPHMRKVRITYTGKNLEVLSEAYLKGIFAMCKEYYVEIDVFKGEKSDDFLKLFFLDGRIISPVAKWPSPAMQRDFIRYASWQGDFPKEEELNLTPKAKAVYNQVRQAYNNERYEHVKEMKRGIASLERVYFGLDK